MASRRSTDPSRSTPAPTRARVARKSVVAAGRSPVSDEARRELIAVAAYLRAEARGFSHGQAESDWLAAEVEVDALLRVNPRATSQ